MPAQSQLPPATSIRPTQGGQDTVVLHCALCPAQADFAIACGGDYSERNVWQATRQAALAQGWALTGRSKPGPAADVPADAEWLCPMCTHRRAVAAATSYPPYSGPNCACGKCGAATVDIKYEAAPAEHLRRTCGTCGYAWNEAVRVKRSAWWRVRQR